MNARRRKFAHEYVKNGFNGVRAVYAAGYSQTYGAARVTAHRLLTDANTIRAVETNLKRSKMNADEVLERLAEIARKDAKFSGSDVVKANELLGKGHKLFVERVEQTEVPQDSLKHAQEIYAKEYQKLNACSPEDAMIAAESAFSFSAIEDKTGSEAS